MTDRMFAHITPIIGAASGLLLLTAFAFQTIAGLEPCVLCIYQRWPHALALALGVAAFVLPDLRRGTTGTVVLGVLAATLSIGAGIAGYHVGVEQKWWTGTPGCGVPQDAVGALSSLTESLLNAPVARCDEIPWSFLGLSMAAWNGVLSLTLAGVAVIGLVQGIPARLERQARRGR